MAPVNTHITRGGQVSIPADIRRRWGTDQIVLEDQGDVLLLRPAPFDPIRAARGSLRLPKGVTAQSLSREAHEEEAEIERRRER